MTDNAHLDRIAETLWSELEGTSHLWSWDNLDAPSQDHYRRVARAVLDDLELTEERNTFEAFETRAEMGGVGDMSYGGQTSRSLGYRTESRLVGPWRADRSEA